MPVWAAEFVAISAKPQYSDPVQAYRFDLERKSLLWTKALTKGETIRSVDLIPDAGLILVAGYSGTDKGFVDLRSVRALGVGKLLPLEHKPSLGVRYARSVNGTETLVYPFRDTTGRRTILEVPLDGSTEREFQGDIGDIVTLGTTYQAAIPWVLDCQPGVGDITISGWGDLTLPLSIQLPEYFRNQGTPTDSRSIPSIGVMTQDWSVISGRSANKDERFTYAINRKTKQIHPYVSGDILAGLRLVDDTIFVQIDEPKAGAKGSRTVFWRLSDGKYTEVKAPADFEILAGLGNMSYIARLGQRLATIQIDAETGRLIIKDQFADGPEYLNVHWGARVP
jgi:hypothetical protein